jgi:RNA polymerase sigma factor (sigma-70 family)
MENFERLIASQEFTNQVNQIANTFRVDYNEELKNDVRQVCMLAAWEAYQMYDSAKTNGNFWGYAYLRMREYAKREVAKHRNIVHLPMNRIEGSNYDRVTHSYEDLVWEDGHDKFGSDANCADVRMDIAAALDQLDEETRYIFEVHAELKEGRSGKSDFNTIAEELGIPTHVVRQRFIAAKEQLATYLA